MMHLREMVDSNVLAVFLECPKGICGSTTGICGNITGICGSTNGICGSTSLHFDLHIEDETSEYPHQQHINSAL
jgi:hypothetical protein